MSNSTNKNESVDHPEHYNPGVYEVINIIEHYNLGFHLGNVLKYILRADKKHDTPVEDIDKALWYLRRYRENLTGNNTQYDTQYNADSWDDYSIEHHGYPIKSTTVGEQ